MSLRNKILGNKKATSIGLAIVVVLGIFLVTTAGGGGGVSSEAQSATSSTEAVREVALVKRENAGSQITASGEVEAKLRATVAAESSGVISGVPVEIGQRVSRGQVLARFSNADEQAALASAEAQLAKLRNGARPEELANSELAEEQSEVSLEDARASLEDTRIQQNENVEDAEEALLNTDLQAYLADSDVSSRSSLAQPIISGTYDATERGQYRLDVYSSGADSGASFRLSGLETGLGTVSTETPQPLGTRGLFIQFPDNFSKSSNVQWVVPTPNERSGQYTAAKNALEKAEQTRDEAIRRAEVAVETAQGNASQSENNLEIARQGARSEDIAVQEAQVASARARLAKTVVRAPFSGTVLSLSATAGEYKSPGQAIAKLLDENSLEVRVYLSAENAQRVSVGDTARVDDSFNGEVVAVAPAIDEETGSVEVRLRLPQDTEITAGSFVDVVFAPSSDSDANETATLPLSAVGTSGGSSFVLVVNDDDVLEKVEIGTGSVVGERVEIEGELPQEGIVANIRGLEAGQEVSVVTDTADNE